VPFIVDAAYGATTVEIQKLESMLTSGREDVRRARSMSAVQQDDDDGGARAMSCSKLIMVM
jgi:hypothetical protein